MKLNKKGNATYAFAKDDLAFKELLAHANPAVRELAAAKMAMSSTLEESRLKRLITLHDIKDGWLPVPLVFNGSMLLLALRLAGYGFLPLLHSPWPVLALELLHRIGPDRVMWSSDYPHQESTFGYSRSAIQAVFDATTVENAQKILGKTAIDLFGLR